jgi:iron(III) transport system permease protein
VALGAGAAVAFLVVVPVGYLLWGAFFDGPELTLAFFEEAYALTGLGSMVSTSFAFAAGSTALAVGAGTGLAFLVARTDLPLRRTLLAAALIPLVLPGVLYAIAWILLAGPRAGLVNEALGRGTVDVFGLTGMIVVEGLHLAPLVLLLMVAAFRAGDGTLEEAAHVSGARPLTVLRRVTIPLVRPALAAAALVTAVRALGAFEVPALVGIPGNEWVFTSRIFGAADRFPPDLGEAGAASVTLLVLTVLGVLLAARTARRGERFQTLGGRRRAPARIALGRWRGPLTAVAGAYVLVAAVLPFAMLVWMSVQPYIAVPSGDSLGRATLRGYTDALGDPRSLRALGNSLLLGAGAATVTVLLAATAAWVVVRSRVPGRRSLDALAALPLAVPGVVLGVALLFVWLRSPLPVYGTLWILLLAYVTQALPYAMRFAGSALQQLGTDVEEVARVSGASWLQAFRRIVLPLIAPALAGAWLYVVVFSMRDLSSSLLLYSPGNEVLAVRIWQQYESGDFTELAALGVIAVVLIALLLAAAYRLTRWRTA